MKKRHHFKFDKLIRDKLPAIIRSKKIDVIESTLKKEEYLRYLKNKLLEETHEVIQSKPEEILEELGDLLEVIHALSNIAGFTMEQVETSRVHKKLEKGGFDNCTYVSHVEMDSDSDHIAYYRAYPEKYPEEPQ